MAFLTAPRGAPRLAYWGPDIDDGALEALQALHDRPFAPSRTKGAQALAWLPLAGEGWSGWPGLSGHRNGDLLIVQPDLFDVQAEAGAARARLRDALAGIEIEIQLTLDATGVATSRTRLINRGEAPLTLDWLACAALPAPHDELLTFDGRWGLEFQTRRHWVQDGLTLKENRTGRTSHHAPPFLVVGEPGFSEGRGEVIGLHLAWSGESRMLVERLGDGQVQIQAGVLLQPGEVILAPGEAFETPALHMARSDSGLTGLSDRFHPFVRTAVLHRRLESRPRPVTLNSWEAIYFDHDAARLSALVTAAAAIGVERFVLDDGWFKGRRHDRAGLGDWMVDPQVFPEGLGPLIAHVQSLGMAFGLWVEPEMANADSDLLRAHPDWILGDPARSQPLGRHQYVLDLTRQEVAQSVFDALDALLRQYPIAYLKWDMNRDLTHGVSRGRAAGRAQTLAVYALIDRLRAAHPGVDIESCASGGGRADYEVLRRTDRIWTSDCNDPLDRQVIQRGFSIFFPPEVMGAHVGARTAHTTGRAASMRTRALTALAGHFGIEADPGAMTASEREELATAVALYKRLRGLLHNGRTVRLEHEDPGLIAFLVVNEAKAFVSAAQIATPQFATLAPLRLRGLDPAASFAIETLFPPRRARATLADTPFLARGEPVSAPGMVLQQSGLPLPALRAGEIAAFVLTREDR
jgi:alpha-galactosidase